MRGRSCLKLNVQGQDGGRILDVAGQGEWGLENWTIFMEAISASSLMFLTLEEVHLKIHQAVACKSSRENFIGAFDIW